MGRESGGRDVIVCMYKGRPAGYKIMGIDTEREKTSMLHRPKKRKSESDRKRMMGNRVSIRSENSPYRSKACMQSEKSRTEK